MYLSKFKVLSLILTLTLKVRSRGIDSRPKEPTEYIYGGSEVEPRAYPWVISIRYFGIPICAGTLISQEHVLTVAHCAKNLFTSRLTLTAGEHHLFKKDEMEQTRYVSALKIHPLFNSETLENDIALFRVSDPFVSTEAVLPAKLPIESYKPKSLFLHKIGWGLTQGKNVTQAGRLLKVIAPLYSSEDCKAYVKAQGVPYFPGRFCAGGVRGEGVCSADSGGPTHSEDTVIGMASASAVLGCGRQGHPALFTNVSYYSDWIKTGLTELSNK